MGTVGFLQPFLGYVLLKWTARIDSATAAAVASTNSTCASIKGYVLGMGSDIGTKGNIPDIGVCCTECQNNVSSARQQKQTATASRGH